MPTVSASVVQALAGACGAVAFALFVFGYWVSFPDVFTAVADQDIKPCRLRVTVIGRPPPRQRFGVTGNTRYFYSTVVAVLLKGCQQVSGERTPSLPTG